MSLVIPKHTIILDELLQKLVKMRDGSQAIVSSQNPFELPSYYQGRMEAAQELLRYLYKELS